MPFISNGVYVTDSTDPNAKKLNVNTEYVQLSPEFCNNRLYRYEYALYEVISASGPYRFTEEPYFVIGSDFYIAGMISDPKKSSSDGLIHFTVYHMDTQTYTDGTIPIPWFTKYSRETVSSNYSDYYIIQPIKYISGLKFYAFIVDYYGNSSANINALCIIDYENLTSTKIVDIPSTYDTHLKLYPGIQSKLLVSSFYVSGSPSTDLYQINTSTGAYTKITYDDDAGMITKTINNNTLSALSGYAYYPSNDYRFIWKFAEDIDTYNSTSFDNTKSNNIYNQGGLEICNSYARLIPQHFRIDSALFIYVDSHYSPQCNLVSLDEIDTSASSSDDYSITITHLANMAHFEYLDQKSFMNHDEDLRNFQGTKCDIRPPMVIDYSSPTTVWGMSLRYFSMLQWNGYESMNGTYIAKYTLNMEDK